jgi:4'-phosphopantetheinyl transferase
LLRLLLGAHLRLPPESVPLGRGSFGKPFVSTGPGKPAISFNVAHSGQLVLLAFHSGREVGVDVEAVRPDLDCEPLAEQVFSPAEKRDWQRLDTAARTRAFFRAWTRHEARLKATGSGLVGPDIEGNTCERFELQLPAGYEGALALRCEV